MPTREFTDRSGRTWTVWAVHPTSSERRHGAADPRTPPRSERRHHQGGSRPRLRAEFAAGWLACETRGEKRRVAPIPPEWERLPDEALAALCERAPIATPSRRLAD